MSLNYFIEYGIYTIIGITGIILLLFTSYKSNQYNKKLATLTKENEQFNTNETFDEYKKDIMKLVNEIRISTENHTLTKETIKELDSMFTPSITGRNSIDAIITSKTKLCKNKNIILELNVAPIRFENIIDADLIPLLGNVLDNAIEAAILSEEKYVKLTIINIKSFNVIKISNTKETVLNPLKNNFFTTKEDTSKHGLGTKIVKMITEKNDGKITYTDNGNEFIVKIILPT